MLNILRKNAQSVVVQAIVVIIAVVFIFWGVGTQLRNNSNAVAVVNGKEIAYRDFQQSYERAVETYKQQFGGQVPQKFFESIGLKEMVLNQLIQSELLRQGAEKIGIMVSKDATQKKIQEMAVFNDKDGHFDFSSYKAVLERNRLSPTIFETGIQNELRINRVADAVKAFASLPGKEVQNWLEYTDQEIKIAYASFKSESYISQVKVNEEELQAWYANNKQNYKSPPQNKLQYLFFNSDDDLKQVKVNEDEMKKYYDENSARYNEPEQRRARHILFKVSSDDRPEIKAAKKTEAERILTKLKNNGDFIQLATQYSDDPSKTKGGDLGFFSRGKMVKTFEDAVFSLKKGEISGLIESPYGYHLVKVEEIIPEKMQSFNEVKESIQKELEKRGGKSIAFKRASAAYEDIIRAGSIAKYSAQSGYPVKKTDFFEQNNPPQESVLRDRSFLQAAFALKKGELSSVVEVTGGYAIIFVDDTKEAMVPDLAAVRDRVVADYKKMKSVDLARTAAEDALKLAKEKQSWPTNLERKESEYMKRVGASGAVPELVRQDAFTFVGKGLFPEKVVALENMFYVYQIIDIRQKTDETDKERVQQLEPQLLAMQNNKLMADWMSLLRKKAKIWTNARMLQ